MSGNDSRQAEPEEDVWAYKEPAKGWGTQFAAGSLTRPKRILPAGTSLKKSQDGGPATIATSSKDERRAGPTTSAEVAALVHAYEEQRAAEEAANYDNPPVDDEVSESDHASSQGGEQSPTVEDFETDYGGIPAMEPGQSLNDELGSDYSEYSDDGTGIQASSYEDDLTVDPVRTSPPASSNVTSDESSDAGNHMVESTSTASAQSLEASIQEIRRERDGLKKTVESRDVRTAELEKELESRDKRTAALETDLDSRGKRIAALAKELESHGEKVRTLEKELETREGQVTALSKDLESRDEKLTALDKERESHDKELAALKKQLESRDREISALQEHSKSGDKRIAALEKDLESRNKELESRAERITAMKKDQESRSGELAALEQELELREKRISGLEAQNSQLANKTAKTTSTSDAATNTEASPGDAVSRPNSFSEAEHDQRLVTAQREQSSSPMSSLAINKAELVRFIQVWFDMLKPFYFAFISLAGTASRRASSFLSSVGRSDSFKRAVNSIQKSARASAMYLATPFWIIMSFAMFMSIWRERSYWVQANAVTRRHLLKHATGVSEIADWEVFFAIGSAALS
ncbi:hypothetical protein J3F83DRAFT_756065 [Trichoderma novae-zelandiae]